MKNDTSTPCPAETALLARGYREITRGIGGDGAIIWRREHDKSGLCIDVYKYLNVPNLSNIWEARCLFAALGKKAPERYGPYAEVKIYNLNAEEIARRLPEIEKALAEARKVLCTDWSMNSK